MLKKVGLIFISLVAIILVSAFMSEGSHYKDMCEKIPTGMTMEQLRTLASKELKGPIEIKGVGHYLVGNPLSYGCDIEVEKGVVTSAKYKLMD